MARVYYAPFDDLQITTDADQDVWEIGAGADKCLIHGFELTSEKTTGESIDLRLVRRSTTGNGSAVTEVRANVDDSAPLAALESVATTPGTIGDIIQAWKWEQLGPLSMLYTPEMRPVVEPNGFMCLNIQSALGATTGWSGWLCWEEI